MIKVVNPLPRKKNTCVHKYNFTYFRCSPAPKPFERVAQIQNPLKEKNWGAEK